MKRMRQFASLIAAAAMVVTSVPMVAFRDMQQKLLKLIQQSMTSVITLIKIILLSTTRTAVMHGSMTGQQIRIRSTY